MMEEYRNSVDEQHASEQLIQDTLAKMQQEVVQPQRTVMQMYAHPVQQKAKKKVWKWVVTIAATAACLGIVFGVYRMNGEEKISYVRVQSTEEIGNGVYLGGDMEQPESLASGVRKKQLAGSYQLPQGILDAEPWEIDGTSVLFGYDPDEEICYAAYQEDGVWILLYSSRLDKEAFGDAVTACLQE